MKRWTAIARLFAPAALALSSFALGCVELHDTTLMLEGADDASTHALVNEARRRWESVGIEVPEELTALRLPSEQIVRVCGGDPKAVLGCWSPEFGAVFISSDASPALQLATTCHEIGHLIRNRPGHLSCPDSEGNEATGDDVMCTHGTSWKPTERDARFVSGAFAAAQLNPQVH